MFTGLAAWIIIFLVSCLIVFIGYLAWEMRRDRQRMERELARCQVGEKPDGIIAIEEPLTCEDFDRLCEAWDKSGLPNVIAIREPISKEKAEAIKVAWERQFKGCPNTDTTVLAGIYEDADALIAAIENHPCEGNREPL